MANKKLSKNTKKKLTRVIVRDAISDIYTSKNIIEHSDCLYLLESDTCNRIITELENAGVYD